MVDFFSSKWKVLRVFFKDPLPESNGFQLREICRKAELSPVSVINYLRQLAKEELIIKKQRGKYPVYTANRENRDFKFLKVIDTLFILKHLKFKELKGMSFTEFIDAFLMPDAIVLFGSAAKGEDVKGSDIDLLVIAKEKEIKEKKSVEQMLERKISIFSTKKFNKLSKELKNNMLNGIILEGFIQVY